MTNKDFVDCGWKEALANADRGPLLHGYRLRHITFSAAAEKANGEGRQTHGRVLALLANACSMELSPDSVNEPFKPFADFRPGGGGCSSTLDSFSEGDLAFFGLIIERPRSVVKGTTHRHFVAHAPTARCEFRARRNRCLSSITEKIWAFCGSRTNRAATRDTSILASDCWKRC